MSSVPTPIVNATVQSPHPVFNHDELARRIDKRYELSEMAEALSKLKETLEAALTTAKSEYVSLRARALAEATAGTLKGVDLQKTTKFLLDSQKTIEKLEKYMKGWTYVELARESLFGGTEREKQEARYKLGYTITKDTSTELAKLAHEVGLLSEKYTAKEFLVKILGKATVLGLEGLELPATVAWEVMSPTELGDDTLAGAKQWECKNLIDNGAPASKVNKCMAEALALQRGKQLPVHNVKKPSHIHKKYKPLTSIKRSHPRNSIEICFPHIEDCS